MASVFEQLDPTVQERMSRQFEEFHQKTGVTINQDDLLRGAKATFHEDYSDEYHGKPIDGWLVASKQILMFSGDDAEETWHAASFGLGNIGAYNYDAGMFRIFHTRRGTWTAISCGPTIGFDLDDLACRPISDREFSAIIAEAGPRNTPRLYSALNHEGAPPSQSAMAVESAKFIKWPLPNSSKMGALVVTNRRLYASPDKGPGDYLEWHQITALTMEHKTFRGDHITVWVEGEAEPRIVGTHMGFFEKIQAIHATRTGPV